LLLPAKVPVFLHTVITAYWDPRKRFFLENLAAL
jgi:hypothetical protein